MAADMLVEFRGLQPPPANLGMILTDGAIAVAFGLLASWIVVQTIRAVTSRRLSPERVALLRLEAIKQVAGAEGLTERALILQELANTLPEPDGDWLTRLDRHLGGLLIEGTGKGLRDALYRPGVRLNLDRFDRDLKASLERAAR